MLSQFQVTELAWKVEKLVIESGKKNCVRQTRNIEKKN